MLRKLFFVGAALLLSVCVSAQNYNKEKGAIRLLTTILIIVKELQIRVS